MPSVKSMFLAASIAATASLSEAFSFGNDTNSLAPDDAVRLVIGGSMKSSSHIFDYFRENYTPGSVKIITAAGINPVNDAVSLGNLLRGAGIETEWIPVYDENCAESVNDPEIIKMVEEASAIFLGGGQSGRLQSCLFGTYNQQGAPTFRETPLLRALQSKRIVGGSSAGAMNQPRDEILITGHSVESYRAVYDNSVFWRGNGNGFVVSNEVADTHFSERGRQGRLVVFAADVKPRWAFGCDENTAYEWNPSGVYPVVGESGVVINEKGEQLGGGRVTAIMHYLNDGDKLDSISGDMAINTEAVPCRTGTTMPQGSNSIFSDLTYRNVANEMAKYGQDARLTTYHGSPAVEVVFDNSEVKAWCRTDSLGVERVSFTGMRVTMGRASSAFVNEEKPQVHQDYIFELDE